VIFYPLNERNTVMKYTGWDWATEAHDVSIIDDTGRLIDRWALEHTESGIDATIRRLATHDEPGQLPIAIEATHSLVIDRLLQAGHPVVPIHPNAFHATRPRWGAARAKSDPGDSYKLADYLRTEQHRLRRCEPLAAETAELQALVRSRSDLVAAKVAATNQLRAVLDRHWPGARQMFSRLDSKISLAFFDDYPTPSAAARLGPGRMAQFCRRRHYTGRKTPQELCDRLHSAPVPTESIPPTALAVIIHATTEHLRALRAAIAELDTAISDALGRHPKARLLAPMPRIGTINLAMIIAEIGPILDRATSADQVCAETGAAPVTKSSGKHQGVSFRWAVNSRARYALTTFADNSRHESTWAADRYRSARERGKRHPHAVRILSRSWTRVIWACWQNNETYDPAKHENRHKA
jgi:transposase